MLTSSLNDSDIVGLWTILWETLPYRETFLWKFVPIFSPKRPFSLNSEKKKIHSFIFGLPSIPKSPIYYFSFLSANLLCSLFMLQMIVIVVDYLLLLIHCPTNLGESLAKLEVELDCIYWLPYLIIFLLYSSNMTYMNMNRTWWFNQKY